MKHIVPLRKTQATPAIEEAEFALAYKSGFMTTFRFIKSLGANREMAEEVAQAAWVRGWQCRAQLQHSELIVSWVSTIAKNLFLSMILINRRFSELEEAAAPCRMLRTLEADFVMQECTEFESRMLTMYYLEGYTALEIARMENLCATSVRVRLMRIRRSLRERMAIQHCSSVNAQAA